MQKEVTNMKESEKKGALAQWKWHRMRRALLRIESGLLACDSNTYHCRRREDPDTIVEEIASRCHSPESADSGEFLQQEASQGKCDLRDRCSLRPQHRLRVSVKERSEYMHTLSRIENQAGHKSPSNSPEIFMTSSSDQHTTVKKAYRAECPVQTEGSQNDIVERRLLTFSIS